MPLYGALKCGERWIHKSYDKNIRKSKILHANWSANYDMDDECENESWKEATNG